MPNNHKEGDFIATRCIIKYMFSLEYRYFYQSALDKSFRKAGENLNINSSALVRQIYKLENRLKIKLFNRSSTGLELTAQGNLLYNYVSENIEKNEIFLQNIYQSDGDIQTHIKISTVETIAIYFLSTVIKKFQDHNTHTTFETNAKKPDSIIDDLILKKSDIGITFTKEIPKSLEILFEKNFPIGILCSPNHDLAKKEEITILDCLTYPLVFHPGTLTVWKKIQREMGYSSHYIKPRIISNSYAFIKSYLKENTQALFFSTKLGALLEINEKSLIHKSVNNKTFLKNNMGVIINKNALHNKITLNFIDKLIEFFETIR